MVSALLLMGKNESDLGEDPYCWRAVPPFGIVVCVLGRAAPYNRPEAEKERINSFRSALFRLILTVTLMDAAGEGGRAGFPEAIKAGIMT
jgi:hypothetical protein